MKYYCQLKSVNLQFIIIILVSISCTDSLNTGLVAFYHFNGNAMDGSGNGNNCKVIGASLTTGILSKNTSAYYFY
jgi:hypothetical protein